MTDLVTRALRPQELRTASGLFRAALHAKPLSDEEWPVAEQAYQPGRNLGVFDSGTGELLGTARSTDADLTVPGGATVPLAAVTGVGVRADRTRRGVLTELMRAQLDDFSRRAVPAASLYATEGVIYGRFGYGVATLSRSLTVNSRLARLRPEVPAGGECELLDLDTAPERLPGIYADMARLPGMMTRSSYWWRSMWIALRKTDEPVVTVLHHGPHGADGFALYRVVGKQSGFVGTMRLLDLQAGSAEAFAGLWRFLLGVDLVDEIRADGRPLGEPVELLFTDPRACEVTATADETWLRLIDVPTALAARSWEGEPLVVEVNDPMLASNTGSFLVGPDGVERTDSAPRLRLGVDALAMIYLGGWRPSALARVGRVRLAGEGVAEQADRLFGTRATPWCGTFF
ncbi:putative acetyltransferase [Saccharomonospora amisosensis]|uniref:Putative acetyltransferase n=1 Tax=Saccharomonospora amisosensis TaxID=1128677 RepID=A0A7X5UQ62_9PSEU|nr:GNAT family N-acetyltransferase [Saccharomonospora amisosensis]NIJ12182.1 putative acetyltransferase [Saccharomonospora amisosensis]